MREYKIILNNIDGRYKVVDDDNFPFSDAENVIDCVTGALVPMSMMMLDAPVTDDEERLLEELGVLV